MQSLCSRPEMVELSNLVGDFIRYWGFKQIHGRIWCLIFLSKHPMDAGELMQCLGVSKALMSLSLKDLLQYNVIVESQKTDRGTQTYVANSDIIGVITDVLRTREKKMLAQIKTSQQLVADLPEDEKNNLNLDGDRLEKLSGMISEAQLTLDGLLSLSALKLDSWDQFKD